MSNMRRALVAAVLTLLWFIPAASGEAQQGELTWPAVNTGHVIREKTTGSFGSGTKERTVWFLGEEVWEDKKVMVFTDGATKTYRDRERRLLASVRDGTLVQSFDPYFVSAVWPLVVGKSWPNRYRYTDHQRGRTWDNVQFDGKVLAYQEVIVPAGTFKAFKIRLGDQYTSVTYWHSPKIGLTIKSKFERLSGHYLGLGVRETELVSYDLKR